VRNGARTLSERRKEGKRSASGRPVGGLERPGQPPLEEPFGRKHRATAIYYKDWETHRIRRSFSCQFHPELMDDIRDIGPRVAPRYHELKEHDGVRLLARLLYQGMQD
jgi:hypothetical protein